jgi:hypothetical protein
VAPVRVRGARADRQLRCDLLEAVSVRRETHHLELACGEDAVRLEARRLRAPRVGIDGTLGQRGG